MSALAIIGVTGIAAWLVAVGAIVHALRAASRRYPPAPRRRELIDELAADGALILAHQRERSR